MDLFDCTPERLAEELSRYPELYRNAVFFLERSRGLFPKPIGDSVDRGLVQLEEANDIARESDYFVFYVEDTYAQGQPGTSGEDVYEVYQKVNDGLINKLGIVSHWRPVSLETVIEFFEENKISQVFTADWSLRKRLGLENFIDDGNGDERNYSEVGDRDMELLGEKGIAVTLL
jgi:hypothetical protein